MSLAQRLPPRRQYPDDAGERGAGGGLGRVCEVRVGRAPRDIPQRCAPAGDGVPGARPGAQSRLEGAGAQARPGRPVGGWLWVVVAKEGHRFRRRGIGVVNVDLAACFCPQL